MSIKARRSGGAHEPHERSPEFWAKQKATSDAVKSFHDRTTRTGLAQTSGAYDDYGIPATNDTGGGSMDQPGKYVGSPGDALAREESAAQNMSRSDRMAGLKQSAAQGGHIYMSRSELDDLYG